MEQREETEWLRKAQQGDQRAGHLLLMRHADIIYRYFRFIQRLEESQAEDLVQKAFVEIWRALPGYRGEASLKTWILRICQRIGSRHFRTKSPEKQASQEVAESLLSSSPNQEDLYLNKERYETLRSLLEGLQPAFREILYLHYLEELSVVELAQLLKLPHGTVKSRLDLARKALRKRWKGRE